MSDPTNERNTPRAVEVLLEGLERWEPDLTPLMNRHGEVDLEDYARLDLDHVLATLLPVANLIRTLCGQSRLDAAALLEILTGSAPHRR